jgi:hypothetical protein
LFGRDITDISVRGLVEFLTGRGIKAEKTHSGYDFPDLCLNTFNSDLRSEDDPVECLGVGLPEGSEQEAEPGAAAERAVM